MTDRASDRVGTVVTHRRYVPYSHAHYAGNLVDGAYSLGLFGDVATEMCIVLDGDEGLFASYSDVQFKAPMRAGDVLLFHCALVHSSRNITSDRPRRAYRAAYQSFHSTWTPRATPIVVHLGDPSALDVPAEYEPTIVKKFVHKLAARMARF